MYRNGSNKTRHPNGVTMYATSHKFIHGTGIHSIYSLLVRKTTHTGNNKKMTYYIKLCTVSSIENDITILKHGTRAS